MDLDLSGRTALVTGAGRGNGRAIARELSNLGASVIVNDLEADPAEAVAEELNEDGEAVAVTADVSDQAAVEAMVEEGTDALGSVDVLVNNAGVGDAGPFLGEEASLRERFELNIGVHLWGSINCTLEVVDGMVDRGYGKVVNITSIHTKNGVGMSPEYDVGKFSLLGLTKSLALELGREGVRVNAVAPGWVNTRMTEGFTDETHEQIKELNPLGRYAEPEDIADAVAFLASPAADYVNGHELRVDGGQVPIDSWKHDNR
ncbi:SDR family NAD(P)-dependent oxidoreductase [Candidatus Halobonum tyrrellensis]|uniref:3-ketoacyl-(Acyl-carrier-protein) reductase n=1 Tax=Candidatus Halobonum tyrrellensis G22 TaxID=1324957 RepID=V4IV08_9EURY|nr:glucose 1-dehydrogenase [Candidatus Halobonum tyrrellensis]ESP87042.1 3-ketoacyl-(acyl-carrier-protein) reductase [Candidatus Halobonum tyrrellensis G22]